MWVRFKGNLCLWHKSADTRHTQVLYQTTILLVKSSFNTVARQSETTDADLMAGTNDLTMMVKKEFSRKVKRFVKTLLDHTVTVL